MVLKEHEMSRGGAEVKKLDGEVEEIEMEELMNDPMDYSIACNEVYASQLEEFSFHRHYFWKKPL